MILRDSTVIQGNISIEVINIPELLADFSFFSHMSKRSGRSTAANQIVTDTSTASGHLISVPVDRFVCNSAHFVSLDDITIFRELSG